MESRYSAAARRDSAFFSRQAISSSVGEDVAEGQIERDERGVVLLVIGGRRWRR